MENRLKRSPTTLRVFFDDGASLLGSIVRHPPTHDHSQPEHGPRPGGGRDNYTQTMNINEVVQEFIESIPADWMTAAFLSNLIC